MYQFKCNSCMSVCLQCTICVCISQQTDGRPDERKRYDSYRVILLSFLTAVTFHIYCFIVWRLRRIRVPLTYHFFCKICIFKTLISYVDEVDNKTYGRGQKTTVSCITDGLRSRSKVCTLRCTNSISNAFSFCCHFKTRQLTVNCVIESYLFGQQFISIRSNMIDLFLCIGSVTCTACLPNSKTLYRCEWKLMLTWTTQKYSFLAFTHAKLFIL